jgi:uncharacterized membrane protein YgcG
LLSNITNDAAPVLDFSRRRVPAPASGIDYPAPLCQAAKRFSTTTFACCRWFGPFSFRRVDECWRRVVSLVAVTRVDFVTNIYVGNLAFNATDEDLRSAFEQFGEVTSVNIIQDRETGRSRGFAFVEMSNDADAKEAIENLDGASIGGRNVKCNEARPRESRGGGGGGGGGGRGGGGGDRGGYR